MYQPLSGFSKKWAQLLIAVAGALLLASAAQAKSLALDDMPFLKAREKILAAGWLPLRTSDRDTVFIEGKWNPVVPEWDSCPTATAGCFFNYIKGKECLRVFASDTRLTKMIVRENFQEEMSHQCPTGRSVAVSHPAPIVEPRKAKGDPWGPEEGMPFTRAREQILAHGWKPYDVVGENRQLETDASDWPLVLKGWRELAFCYPTGSGACTFHYTKKKECMTVITSGERLQDLKVYVWTDECPPKEPPGGAPAASPVKELALNDMPFLQARKLIISNGWLPLRTLKEEDSIFVEGKWRVSVPEWNSCPSVLGTCRFHYIKGKQCLTVFAFDARLTKTIVRATSDECPEVSGVPVSPPEPIVMPNKAKGDAWGPEEDMPFTRARMQILAHGWKPINGMAGREYGHQYNQLERQVLARRWNEMESCDLNGVPDCTFYYKKKKECMSVTIKGEQLKEMKVDIWTDECPAP